MDLCYLKCGCFCPVGSRVLIQYVFIHANGEAHELGLEDSIINDGVGNLDCWTRVQAQPWLRPQAMAKLAGPGQWASRLPVKIEIIE